MIKRLPEVLVLLCGNLDFSLQLPTICHLFFRAKRSFSKIKSSLSVMTNEGFADIQAKSAEKVQEKLSKLKRCVK